MKNLSILTAIFAVIFTASVAQASVATDIQAAANAGNITQINAIAAANPSQQGAVALQLLALAQSKLSGNPSLAAQIFAAAAPFVSQIPAGQATGAAATISQIVATASAASFNVAAAGNILTAALEMAALPNIVGAAPSLRGSVLSAANDYLGRNPQSPLKKLQDQVSLAQQAGVAPTTQTIGAQTPSGK